jgi:hypothetical protein
VDALYRDFKEDHNCYAVSNAKELSELLNSNKDTAKVVQNARKLLARHISIIMSGKSKPLTTDNKAPLGSNPLQTDFISPSSKDCYN